VLKATHGTTHRHTSDLTDAWVLGVGWRRCDHHGAVGCQPLVVPPRLRAQCTSANVRVEPGGEALGSAYAAEQKHKEAGGGGGGGSRPLGQATLEPEGHERAEGTVLGNDAGHGVGPRVKKRGGGAGEREGGLGRRA